MSARYDAAITTLFRADIGEFVAERKRLAAELKAAGAKEEAAKLAKVPRPPVSAWAVNQLWWTARESFDALLDAASRVKHGDREASKDHREALGALRERATEILSEAGNAASEGTLRRIATTLAAIAASGGFAPDAPGALTSDRDPPGFETFVATAPAAASERSRAKEAIEADGAGAEARRASAAAKAEAEARAAARRAEEEERKRRQAERERLARALKDARELQGERHREVARLTSELERAEQDLKDAQAKLATIESALANL